MKALIGVSSQREIVEQHCGIDLREFVHALLLLPLIDAREPRHQALALPLLAYDREFSPRLTSFGLRSGTIPTSPGSERPKGTATAKHRGAQQR